MRQLDLKFILYSGQNEPKFILAWSISASIYLDDYQRHFWEKSWHGWLTTFTSQRSLSPPLYERWFVSSRIICPFLSFFDHRQREILFLHKKIHNPPRSKIWIFGNTAPPGRLVLQVCKSLRIFSHSSNVWKVFWGKENDALFIVFRIIFLLLTNENRTNRWVTDLSII